MEYGKCKSAKPVASNLIWWEVNNFSNDATAVLAQHEKEKKKTYLELCLEQRRHFTPGRDVHRWLIGSEEIVGQTIKKPYSVVCGDQPDLHPKRE